MKQAFLAFMDRPGRASLILLIGWTSSGFAAAQEVRDDYARAEQLSERTRGKVFRDRVTPRWSSTNDRFWYRVDLIGGSREFVAVDAIRGEKAPAFDHKKLADSLSRASGASVAADRLPFEFLQVEPDGKIRFEANGQGWSYDPTTDLTSPGDPPPRPTEEPASTRPRGENRPRQGSRRGNDSPDGKLAVFVKDHDLYLRDKESKEEFLLADDGLEGDSYDNQVYWSADSRKVVALRTKAGDERKVQLIESSPKDQLQPKLSNYNYLKPGDRVPISKPHLFDIPSRKQVVVSDALFENPYAIEEVRWSPDSSRFTFLFNQRGHQVLRLVAVDATSGESRSLIEETFPTFVDYSNKTYVQFFDKTGEILWMSERDGWNHLYLFDSQTGALKHRITRGEWLVRGIDRVDEEGRQVWFRAMGIFPDQDPYQVHYARVNFDGTGLVRLTEGDGSHSIRYSPDRRSYLDSYSRVDLAPITELRRTDDGKLVVELERGDDSALRSAGWAVPERFQAKGRDGTTDIFGVIFRPTNFDPSKKYPVIEQIYAGPQGAFVPKTFLPLHRTQVLAELGFIVVQIDGMGTNWRSKAFHDVASKNLGDAGFPDRISWLKAAATRYPSMDLTRVGIYGGSAGGQNALGGMLFHGDFYKAAVADCGCHDNRMDKIWWNEAWMGWPIGPHYAEQSNVTNAHKLQGALLLTVGELDHNVDPASTMQVVNALIKANKDFELIVFPGADHGAGGSPYGERRKRDFFVRHLRGIEPPSRNLISTSTGGNH